jgi:hypothetical protein
MEELVNGYTDEPIKDILAISSDDAANIVSFDSASRPMDSKTIETLFAVLVATSPNGKLKGLQSITVNNLCGPMGSDEGHFALTALAVAIKVCAPNVSKIGITGCHLASMTLCTILCPVIRRLKYLRDVDLSYNDIDSHALPELLLVLPRTLECLNLSGNQLAEQTGPGQVGLFLAKSGKRMKKFAFGDMMNQGSDDIFEPLLDGVMALSPAILTNLDLSGVKIGMSPAFNSFLQRCDNLSLLKLKNAAIPTQALLVGLFEALRKKPLVSLALTACGGNVAHDDMFWSKLKPFFVDFPPTLESLYLDDMALTDSFISVAFASIQGNATSLQTLSLRKNPQLTIEGLGIVFSCDIEKLQAFYVSGDGIPEAQIGNIKEHFGSKNCMVVIDQKDDSLDAMQFEL